jgi:hypothetical protein
VFFEAQAEARQELEQLTKRIPTLRITVNGVPAENVELTVDDRPAAAGEVLQLDPGNHRIVAAAPGREWVAKRVVLREGASERLTLVLAVPAAPDGAAEPQPANGVHREPPDHAAGPSIPLLVAGAATAGAAMIVGVGFTLAANESVRKVRSYPDYDQCYAARATAAPGNCAEIDAQQSDVNLFSNMAFWSFIGAGTVGAATAAYALFSPRRSSSKSAWLAPVTMTGGGGISMGGTW